MKFNLSIFPNMLSEFADAVRKFPLSVLSALLFCGLAVYQIEMEPFDEHFILQKLCFTLAVACPLMLAIHLANLNHIKGTGRKYILFAAGFLLLFYLFWKIAPDFEATHLQRPVRFFAYFLMAHLAVSVVAVMDRNRQEAFWQFNSNLLITWVTGAFYALVLFAGLALALVSVDQLFDVHIQGKRYLQLFFIVVSGVHPLFLLSNIPTLKGNESVENDQTKVLKFLVTYILIPLCLLYFIILYAFGLKIVLSWNLPKSWVSSLVLGISGIGVLTYLLNFGLAHQDSLKLSLLFKKYFFWFLFPLVLLLFAGIFRRLSDYGFTPPRYFVLLAGIWLFVMCIYFIVAKSKSILWIPFSLMLMLIIGTMSPVDAFEVSSKSQYKLLLNDLELTNLFENGKLSQSLRGLSTNEKFKLKDRIRQLDYLDELDKVNQLLANPVSPDSLRIAKNPINLIFKSMGIDELYESEDQNEMIYLSGPDQNYYQTYDYTTVVELELNRGSDRNGISLGTDDKAVLIFSGQIRDTLALDPLFKEIELRQMNIENDQVLNEGIELMSLNNKFKIFVKQLNFKKDEQQYQIDYIKALVFAKEK